MFIELMPLLAGRTVLITVAKVDDKTLRVNVIPTQAKADENPALTTPLTFTGSPEELDAELGQHLAGYVQSHQQAAARWLKPKPRWKLLLKQRRRKLSEKLRSARRQRRNLLTRARLPLRLVMRTLDVEQVAHL